MRIYNQAHKRITSRFLKTGGGFPGMVFLISSKTSQMAFLEEHIRKSRRGIEAGTVKVSEYAIWDVKPKRLFVMPKFRVEIGDETYASRIITDEDIPRDIGKVIDVPGEYLDDFVLDCETALRDHAGISTVDVTALIRDREAIKRCISTEFEHPFERQDVMLDYRTRRSLDDYFNPEKLFSVRHSRRTPKLHPHAARFAHIDFALTQDCAGIAIGHVGGFKKIRRMREDYSYYEENSPVIYIDLMLRILPPRGGGEISVDKVRRFIVNLRDMGLPIIFVSADGYQCFTGDTKVSLLDGTERRIKDLAGKKKFYVYSYDVEKGKVVPGVARNARRTGKRAAIFKVTLDNGETVKATASHLWLTRKGEYVRTIELKRGTSLMPLYRRTSGRPRDSMSGYEMVRHPGGSWEYTHLVVHKSSRPKDAAPEGDPWVNHHKNENRKDNRPQNLEWRLRSSHMRHHGPASVLKAIAAPWTDERRKKLSDSIKKRYAEDSAYRAQSVARLNLHRTPENTSKRSPAAKKKLARLARERNKPGPRHPRRLKHITVNAVIDAAIANPTLSQRQLGAILGVTQDVVAHRLEESGVGKSRGWQKRLDETQNHKVVSVEFAGFDDVYDFDVDRYHNFALSSGVFVHNSAGTLQILASINPPFATRKISIDKNDEPYCELRQAIMEERICYYSYPPFLSEVRNLLHDVTARKVDHPVRNPDGTKGSKDVADCLAGVTVACLGTPNIQVGEGSTFVMTGGADKPEISYDIGPDMIAALDKELARRTRVKRNP